MSNRLSGQSSPYLLQHAQNPVDWYPWGTEAFERAKAEDKPVFLSIGYSTCHWCHVMAHESFEDLEIAELLNRYFISVKVDREERPDIDAIYMAACQVFTGGGGWPLSVFLTPAQEPFFAGTYFPRTSRGAVAGFRELLTVIHEKWEDDRAALLGSASEVMALLNAQEDTGGDASDAIISRAVELYKRSFDGRYGGFGAAPKFPAPHNLIFLLTHYEKSGDTAALAMAEKTLMQMYRGGLFDHIGFGFCRYSTDERFLIPHFEKMLYDNALLISAYARAYSVTKKPAYLEIAKKTAEYVLRELTSEEGGFYSAQDADSEGVEGKYYALEPSELTALLGAEAGEAFNRHYGITQAGNFEGGSIPNLLHTEATGTEMEKYLPSVREFRRKRSVLRLDDKILTSWNSLMISGLCALYRVSADSAYLKAAKRAEGFIKKQLSENGALYVSFREGVRGGPGYIDDYALYMLALTDLYEATLESGYLQSAKALYEKAEAEFSDKERGGFYLYGARSERLILRPKETYDGAVPSGNSAMAYGLVRLYLITGEERFMEAAKLQLDFMAGAAQRYPVGYALALTALSDWLDPPMKVTAVPKKPGDLNGLPLRVPLCAVITALEGPQEGYPLKDDRTTYYVCRGHACEPPVNELDALTVSIIS